MPLETVGGVTRLPSNKVSRRAMYQVGSFAGPTTDLPLAVICDRRDFDEATEVPPVRRLRLGDDWQPVLKPWAHQPLSPWESAGGWKACSVFKVSLGITPALSGCRIVKDYCCMLTPPVLPPCILPWRLRSTDRGCRLKRLGELPVCHPTRCQGGHGTRSDPSPLTTRFTLAREN